MVGFIALEFFFPLLLLEGAPLGFDVPDQLFQFAAGRRKGSEHIGDTFE